MRILPIILLCFFLFGCERFLPGSKKIKSASAYVVQKNIKPSYSVEFDDSTSIYIDEGFEIKIPGTKTVKYPETYYITVYYRNEDDKKCEVIYKVEKPFFDSLHIEDQVYIDLSGIRNEKFK